MFLFQYDNDVFWCHTNSPLLHPVGWSLSVGHKLTAPQGKEFLAYYCFSAQICPPLSNHVLVHALNFHGNKLIVVKSPYIVLDRCKSYYLAKK